MMEGIIVNILKAERFTGEDQAEYVKLTKEILTPRKTYVKGEISGKYRGDRMFLESDRPNMSLFDFEIYEAQVICESRDNFRKNTPFELSGKIKFPREKLPNQIPVSIQTNGISYDVNILEPSLYDFESVRKYRQIHGDEVYGHFTAYILGYVFDYERAELVEIVPYVEPVEVEEVIEKPEPYKEGIVVSAEPEIRGYKKIRLSDRYGSTRYQWWHSPGKIGLATNNGCLSSILGFIGVMMTLVLLIVVMPNFFYVLLIIGIYLLFSYWAPYLKWFFRIASAAFSLFFLFALAHGIWNKPNRERRTAAVQDERETITPILPNHEPLDNTEQNPDNDRTKDYIIKRFRKWQDYAGNLYEGYYEIRKSDFDRSHQFKSNMHLSPGSMNGYDEMVYRLKEHDENYLSGIYHMLDSIKTANALAPKEFAEMTVSMVQDIPYSLVLESACNASLYRDRFIRDWLTKSGGYCDPFQRFGINSPIEFVTNLKGDCDTRTLFLYTLLSHYNFDVVLLSSEVYKHSLLGINLPVQGVTYPYHGARFVVWETTAAQMQPGVVNPEMANMKNWRISLKSIPK